MIIPLKLKHDRIKCIENKILHMLVTHKQEFIDTEHKKLTSHYIKASHFYGLLKIYRPNIQNMFQITFKEQLPFP